MPRKLRLEFPGACYHVINRGNYRADIFRSAGARAAFETCLFEVCGRSGWLLHAYVLMSNHYHLALETPQANLVSGMQWVQATFANRFNRLRGEQGHLFQGRYKALLVEEGEPLGQVCHYIHLNPVRANLVTVAQLPSYRHSSYWYFGQPRQRPDFLRCDTALREAGGLADTPAGWASYAGYLTWQVNEGPAGKSRAYVSMSEGWALGTREFKQALRQDHALAESARAWTKTGVREMREEQWHALLDQCLAKIGKTKADAQRERKGAPWKAKLAHELKANTQATNRWLTEQLHMGRPEAVSVYLGRYRKTIESTQ